MGNSCRSSEDLNSGMNMDSESQECEVAEGRKTLSGIGLEVFNFHSVMYSFFLYFVYVLRLCGRLSLEMMN